LKDEEEGRRCGFGGEQKLRVVPMAAESIPVDSAREELGCGLGKVEEAVGEPWA